MAILNYTTKIDPEQSIGEIVLADPSKLLGPG